MPGGCKNLLAEEAKDEENMEKKKKPHDPESHSTAKYRSMTEN